MNKLCILPIDDWIKINNLYLCVGGRKVKLKVLPIVLLVAVIPFTLNAAQLFWEGFEGASYAMIDCPECAGCGWFLGDSTPICSGVCEPFHWATHGWSAEPLYDVMYSIPIDITQWGYDPQNLYLDFEYSLNFGQNGGPWDHLEVWVKWDVPASANCGWPMDPAWQMVYGDYAIGSCPADCTHVSLQIGDPSGMYPLTTCNPSEPGYPFIRVAFAVDCLAMWTFYPPPGTAVDVIEVFDDNIPCTTPTPTATVPPPTFTPTNTPTSPGIPTNTFTPTGVATTDIPVSGTTGLFVLILAISMLIIVSIRRII